MPKEKRYILVSMNDERAKSIAKVLGDKNCDKIINYLMEKKEASEKDIADALNIKLNTIEYNLKKLLKSELIKKSKNFFWSKKGKKINMYQLSNKSIVISPTSSKISSGIRAILPIILISIITLGIISLYLPTQETQNKLQTITDIQNYLEKIDSALINTGNQGIINKNNPTTTSKEQSAQSEIEISEEIIQSRGNTTYVISKNKVTILENTKEKIEILSEIEINEEIKNVLIEENKLIILTEKGIIYVYDLSNKTSPIIEISEEEILVNKNN